MMKQRWLLTFGFLFSVGTVGSAQSLLDGTPFNASIYNLPDSVGAVRLIDTAGSDCRSDEGVPGFDVVPVEEVANAAEWLLTCAGSITEDALVDATARLFGYPVRGRRIDAAMNRGIARLLDAGRARRDGARLLRA